MPGATVPDLAITVVEQRLHVDRVELARTVGGEIGAYVGQIVVDAVAARDEVSTHHVVLAAGRQHGGDGAAGDVDRPPLGLRVIRVKPAVADDIGNAPPLDADLPDLDGR